MTPTGDGETGHFGVAIRGCSFVYSNVELGLDMVMDCSDSWYIGCGISDLNSGFCTKVHI